MKLNSITKEAENLYKINYVNWFGTYKERYVFDRIYFRWADTGRILPFMIDTALGELTKNMKIGQKKQIKL